MQDQTVKLTDIYSHPLYNEAQAVLHNIFTELWRERHIVEQDVKDLETCSDKVEELQENASCQAKRIEDLLSRNSDLRRVVDAKDEKIKRLKNEAQSLTDTYQAEIDGYISRIEKAEELIIEYQAKLGIQDEQPDQGDS